MAMLITKFHSLIRSRLLWIGFLVIIVFVFVIWGTAMPSRDERSQSANSAGRLDGKPVPMNEFRQAYFHTYMSLALNYGRVPDITPEFDKELRRNAWRRLAALRQARELGLVAGDDEVVGTIQAHPGFSVENRFSPPQYQAFIQNVLNRMGFSERQFEEHVREEISLQKMQFMLQQGLLVAPHDVQRAIQTLSDTFELDYILLAEKDLEAGVQVTEEDARSLFLKDPALFTLPEKVSVRYVELPLKPYLDDSVATEENAILYYDDHMSDFTRTNRVRVGGTEGDETPEEEAAWTNQVEQIPFDEVKTNILTLLTRQAAREKAIEAATELVIQLAPDREGRAPTFDAVAEKAGLEIQAAGPFALNERLEQPGLGLDFNRTAFLLRDTPDEYFSDALAGEDSVFILALDQRHPSRVPEFEEVADEVMTVARRQALNDALLKKGQELREAALAAAQEARPFAEAVKSFELKVENVGPFTLTEGLEEHEYAAELLRAALSLNQGEVGELITVDEGLLLVHARARKAGDATELQGMSQQIIESIRRQRSRTLFAEWEEHLLRAGGLEDTSSSAREMEDTEDEDEDELPGES